MPYAPPSPPFVAGNPIIAADVDGNLEAAQSYINGGIVAADLYTGSIFELNQQNMARGHYNPINNSLQMVSGVAAGHHSMAAERSFIVGAPTNLNSPTTPQDVYVQNSAISFFVEPGRYDPGPGPILAKGLFQFHMTPIFVPAGTLNAVTPGMNPIGSAAIYLDGVRQAWTRVQTRREVQTVPVTGVPVNSPAFPHYRVPWSNFFATTLQSGWHTIGLEGRTFGHYIMNVAWGVTLEIYY